MLIAIACLTACAILGLHMAWLNLRDDEAREWRLQARRAQRAARRKPRWYIQAELERIAAEEQAQNDKDKEHE